MRRSIHPFQAIRPIRGSLTQATNRTLGRRRTLIPSEELASSNVLHCLEQKSLSLIKQNTGRDQAGYHASQCLRDEKPQLWKSLGVAYFSVRHVLLQPYTSASAGSDLARVYTRPGLDYCCSLGISFHSSLTL